MYVCVAPVRKNGFCRALEFKIIINQSIIVSVVYKTLGPLSVQSNLLKFVCKQSHISPRHILALDNDLIIKYVYACHVSLTFAVKKSL